MKIFLSLVSALIPILLMASCTNEVEKAVVDPEEIHDDDYYNTSTDTSVTGQAVNVTFCGADLGCKINVRTLNSLPVGSTFGVLISSSNPDPTIGGEGVRQVFSKVRTLIYSCPVTGLNMGTRYYFRSFLREGGSNGKIHLGRVFYFTTLTCTVQSLAPSALSYCTATVGGRSDVCLENSSFEGSFGILYTSRQTDRPNAAVDVFAEGTIVSDDAYRFEVKLSDLSPSQKYVFQAYLKVDTAYYYGPVQSFTTWNVNIVDNDLPVDLGLSVRWAARNVGANSASAAGGYFGYGDPTGEMTTSDYTKYPNSDIINNRLYDIARVNNGDGWQMPSFEQFEELVTKCDWRWMTYNGVQGYAVLSRSVRNAIFLPAGGCAKPDTREVIGADMADPIGYYWTGNITQFSRFSYSLKISSSERDYRNLDYTRAYGFMVRAVAE